ncbi:MAG TPA: hypothetical protein VN081_03420 [Dongiaceae bacterium]|nr:hypothetical protein [Dongiaceae bacterium]
MTLFANETSLRTLQKLIASKTSALLVAGPSGVGLKTLTENILQREKSEIIPILPEKNDRIDLEKGRITVESIRRLYDVTKTVQPKGRVIVIDYAERMAAPAQNAFLKLLEEPPEATRFVLLSHTPELLLPTILSRVQRIDVRPIGREQSLALLDELKVTDATKRAQLLFIAEGLPAMLYKLATDDTYFADRAAIVKDARQLITGTPYNRLLLAKQYKDDREKALTLLNDAMRQVSGSLVQSGEEKALRTLTALQKTHQTITEQGNIRLQLSQLAVQ